MSADLLSNFIGMTLHATGNNNAWGAILIGQIAEGEKKVLTDSLAAAIKMLG